MEKNKCSKMFIMILLEIIFCIWIFRGLSDKIFQKLLRIMTAISKNCPSNIVQTMVFMSAAIIAGSKQLVRYFPCSTTKGLMLSGCLGSGFAIASQKLARENESSFERCICVTGGFAVGAIIVAPLSSRFFLEEKTIIGMSGALRFGTIASVINMVFYWIFPHLNPQENVEEQVQENLEQKAPVIEEIPQEENLAEKALALVEKPVALVEQGIRDAALKASKTTYYQSLVDSRPIQTITTFSGHLLSGTEQAFIHWAHSKMEKYEPSENLGYLQVTSQKVEWVFHQLAWVDPSELSTSAILLMQDIQDVSTGLHPYLELREHFLQIIQTGPKKITEICYGSPEKKHNHMSRYSSPIVYKTFTALKPQEETLSALNLPRDQMLIVCSSIEQSAARVFLHEGISNVALKAGRFLGRGVVKWYICETAGWVVATTVKKTYQVMGYEEDEQMAEQHFMTTQKCTSWTLWLLMLNVEAGIWRKHHQQTRREELEASKDQGVCSNVLAKMEEQKGVVGKIAALVLPAASGNLNPHPIPHIPPPLSIWRRGWNGVTSYWNSWFGQRVQE